MQSRYCAHPSFLASGRWGARALPQREGAPRVSCDCGMATLETALMVPVLFAITFVFISLLSLGMQTLSLSDATRTAARELARGAEQDSVVANFAAREPEAGIELQWSADTVTVHTSKTGEVLSGLINLASVQLSQSHTAPREWSY